MTIFVVPDTGWRLDHVARHVYGSERDGLVEALLAANPGLARRGADLPVGTAIAIPPRPIAPLRDLPIAQPWA